MKNHALLVFATAGMMLLAFGASAQEAATTTSEEATTSAEDTPSAEESDATEETETDEAEEAKETKSEEEDAAAATAEAPQADPPEADVPSTTPVTDTADTDTKKDDDKEADEKDEDEEKPFQRPFAASSFFIENQFSAISLDKSHDYTYNPVDILSFGLQPKWAFAKGFNLSTEIAFDTELTNSDYANKRGEVFIRDVPFNVGYKHPIEINDDVKFSLGGGVGLLIPASKVSRYSTLYTSLSLKLSLGFSFPNVLKGLNIGWSPSFKKNFHESQNPKPEKNILDESGISPAEKLTSEAFQTLAFSGGINPSWSVGNMINIGLSITESLSFSFTYGHSYIYKYAPSKIKSGSETDPMGPNPARDTGYNERGIYSNMFVYDLSYTLPEPVHMLTPYINASTISNQLNEDGTYHTPFFNRQTMIGFGISLDIDKTVQAFQGKKPE